MAFEKNMGESSNSKHVNSDPNSKLIPRTIHDILKNVLLIPDGSKKPWDLDSQILSYENELRKVSAFKRELPLCMQLLEHGIEKLNEERLQWEGRQTVPIVTLPTNTEDDDVFETMSIDDVDHNVKRNWVSSLHLWTAPVVYDTHPFTIPSGTGGAFMPYRKPTIIIQDTDVDEAEEISRVLFRPQPHPKKKQRRCWSPELHDLFVDALDKIGGAEVATPKRIIEQMKVEGLTSDEVKSHLQKYRIHIRKTTSLSDGPVNFPWLVNDGDNNNEVGERGSKGKKAERRF